MEKNILKGISMCINITESLCCTADIDTKIVYQLSSIKIKVKKEEKRKNFLKDVRKVQTKYPFPLLNKSMGNFLGELNGLLIYLLPKTEK